MNRFELSDAELDALAAANPIDEQEIASAIPPMVGEAMLREITAEGRVSFFGRLADSLTGTGGRSWGRAGFVGVLAVVAAAVLAVNVASIDGSAEQAPAGETDRVVDDPDRGGADAAEADRPVISPDPTTAPTVPVQAVETDGQDSAADDGATGDQEVGEPSTVEVVDPPADRGTSQTGSRCISVEAESFQLAGAWNLVNDSSASGGAYIVWEGLSPGRHTETPVDVLTTRVDVTEPGTYRVNLAARQSSGVSQSEGNDTWVSFPGSSRFGPVDGGRYASFVTAVGNGTERFGWTTTALESDGRTEMAVEFARAGSYDVQLAGRSHGHQIDRIILHPDSVDQAEAISGRCQGADPTGEPQPVSPVVDGPFDPARDLISLHYDHAPARDDGQATVAARVITDSLGIEPWVVGGAYGTNGNLYVADSELVMRTVWGRDWVNAHADRQGAVTATADRWQTTLDSGGNVWVAEGGQSDLTADVIRELRRRDRSIDTSSRIHLVQHNQWNEQVTTDADLTYVKNNTDYIKIDDGNGSNGTADLNGWSESWQDKAKDSSWRALWALAFDYTGQGYRVDFSDTVEVLHILGIDTDEVADIDDFADRFFD